MRAASAYLLLVIPGIAVAAALATVGAAIATAKDKPCESMRIALLHDGGQESLERSAHVTWTAGAVQPQVAKLP